jgi:LysM repeat protein
VHHAGNFPFFFTSHFTYTQSTMKSKLTIFAVVLLHAVPLFLIIGCRTETGFEDIKADTNTNRSVAGTATAPVETVPGTIPEAIPVGGADTTPIIEVAPPRVEPQPAPVKTAPAPVAEPTGKVYYAKRGDSLSRVAKQEGVSVHALASANGLPDDSGLKLQQKLIIPAKTSGGSTVRSNANGGSKAVTTANHAQPEVSADGTRIHVVSKGEVLGSIARKYGTRVAKIKELNNITDERKVRVGTKLKIPAATKAVATPAPVDNTSPPPAGEVPIFDPLPPPVEPSTVSAAPTPAQPDESPVTEAIRTPATN